MHFGYHFAWLSAYIALSAYTVVFRVWPWWPQWHFKETANISYHDGRKAGVSNSNCSDGQMRTYKVTRGSHYDADTTMAVPEPQSKQLLHLISCKGLMSYMQIISSRLYVCLKGTCFLVGW